MGRVSTPPTPPPPPPPSPTPTRVDTSGQQQLAEKSEKRKQGSASTILTQRNTTSTLGSNRASSTNVLGQG